MEYDVDGTRYRWDGRAAARCRRRVRPGKQRLTQRDVATAVRVSRQMVSMWEAGLYSPIPERVAALAALYQCERAELLAPLDNVSRCR
mgnify:CR=1 FL=1